MLPMPAILSRRNAGSMLTTATAAPRVCPRRSCSSPSRRFGSISSDSKKAATAACDDAAASGPWPRPSATSTTWYWSVSRPAKASPHTSSLAIARVTPPSSTSWLAVGTSVQMPATRTVPSPGCELTSSEVDRRATAPRPTPNVPAVDRPSVDNAEKSVMPGPWSTATTCTPGTPSRNTTCRAIMASSAWRYRFDDTSVTTIPTSPTRLSSKPNRLARCIAARRADPDTVASSTANHSVPDRSVSLLSAAIWSPRPACTGRPRSRCQTRRPADEHPTVRDPVRCPWCSRPSGPR